MRSDLEHRSSNAVSAMTCALVTAVLPLSLLGQQPTAPADVPARLAVVVRTDLAQASLDEWTQWLASATGIPFAITDAARRVPASRTTLVGVRLPPLPAHSVLNILTEITGLSWRIDGAQVAVDVPAPARPGRAGIDPKAKTIFIFGSAGQRGAVPIDDLTTLIELLRRTGSRDDADLHHVRLIRSDGRDTLEMEADVHVIAGGDTTRNFVLRPDDIVYIPQLANDLPPLRLQAGTRLRFVIDPTMVKQDELLAFLTEPQQVGRDGTILVPHVGPVQVLDKTQEEVTALVRGLYRQLFKTEFELHARFLPAR
jgi:protein involved in polysaccharide export with SLBB domain